ncbi:unnamed protein product, partial [marine sediment metagenome]
HRTGHQISERLSGEHPLIPLYLQSEVNRGTQY